MDWGDQKNALSPWLVWVVIEKHWQGEEVIYSLRISSVEFSINEYQRGGHQSQLDICQINLVPNRWIWNSSPALKFHEMDS